MSRQRFATVELSGRRGRLWEMALNALRAVQHAEVVAVVFEDGGGELFIIPLTAQQRQVIDRLAAADWGRVQRIAQEHCP